MTATNRDRWLWVAVVALGGLLRISLVELRPIHHDEAVNWYLVGDVLTQGYYSYDSVNYHGPTFFYLSALGRLLAPESLAGLRLPTALVGTLGVALAWFFRATLGRRVALALGLVLALSPTWVYFARQAIHETLLGVSTLASTAVLLRLLRSSRSAERTRLALWAGVGAGIMWATKETAVLTFVAWGFSAFVLRKEKGLVLPDRRELALAMGMAFAISSIFFGGFGRDPMGVLRPFEALTEWGARGLDGAGQIQPWSFFAHLLLRVELPLLVIAAFGLRRGSNPLARATLVWFATLLTMYSLLPYKTNWCAVQIVLPLALLAAQGAENLLCMKGGIWRGGVLALSGTAALGLVVETSFLRYDEQGLPLVHVQTHRQFHHAMQDLLQMIERRPGMTVRVFYPIRYPINWYLRGLDARREALDPWPEDVDGDVLLASPQQLEELQARIKRPFWRRDLLFRDRRKLALWLDEAAVSGLDDEHEWTREEPVGSFDPPPRPAELEHGWIVRFAQGRDLEAEPFLRERRETVDLSFSDDYEKPRWAPLTAVWEAWFEVKEAGIHDFATLSDDGSRLWIDGRRVVRNWGVHGLRRAEGRVHLVAGWHHVRIDWFDLGGPAHLSVTWTPPGSATPLAWPATQTWSSADFAP